VPVSPIDTWGMRGAKNRPRKCHVLFEYPLIDGALPLLQFRSE